MTDDLVKRHIEQLRLTGGDLADLCQPLAEAIEQLTADHYATLARLADAVAREINLTAERDRLRAIGTEMAESIEGNYYLPGVATRWVAALKGETNE